MSAFIHNLPPFVKSFVIDFIETGLAAAFGAALIFPNSLEDVQADLAVLGVALAGALISAARRALPDFLTWLRGVFA